MSLPYCWSAWPFTQIGLDHAQDGLPCSSCLSILKLNTMRAWVTA
jgi:hypothetical protein